MRVIDYTSSLPPMAGINIHYRNPKYWGGDAEVADFVYTTDQQILAVYLNAGVKEWLGKVERPVTPKSAVEPKEVVIPDNWNLLPWPQMRALAFNISKMPVKSKQDAQDIITREFIKQQRGE